MDLSALAALVSGLNSAKDIAAALVGQRDAQVLATLQRDLTERILDAQARLSELLAVVIERTGRVAELEEAVRQLQRQQLERERYELFQLSPGVLVYRLKPAAELRERQSEPPHFLCQSCLDVSTRKVILIRDEHALEVFHRCPLCQTHYREASLAPPTTNHAHDPYRRN